MPEPPTSSSIYLGEYGWAPAFKHDCSYYANWIKPEPRDGTECPVMIQAVSSSYLCESGDFDCSVEDTFYLRLPSQEFIDHLGLQ